ncbi:MAG TPA: hypothetical protein OIL97_06855 [Oscillospiraceae bacterium]|nr:hypothetical protein [Ruminococcus sp. 1001270H_150608_F2]HJI49231.1 hypothetical protein [Oscillospiraceae bacterium]
MMKNKNKIKLIGFLLLMMAIVVISLSCHISINTKYGGIFLLPALYILVTYTVPKMVQDYIEEFKKSCNKYDYAITKNQFCDKCIYEATGKEVEELKHIVEGQEV